ncbi:MAG: DUF4492 domain-containing protein [Bacteroidales bacterium]|nr:DUF4492 domain-containing protein [Bacteroidales bacterium]
MKKTPRILSSFWALYRDGFKNMTWGRPLVWLILLKLFILFAVLRVFFFKPAMRGMTDEQKSEQVWERLTTHGTDTLETQNR